MITNALIYLDSGHKQFIDIYDKNWFEWFVNHTQHFKEIIHIFYQLQRVIFIQWK